MKGQPEDRDRRLEAAISELFIDTILEQGGRESRERYQQLFRADARLNAQGLNVWLVRLEKSENPGA